MATLEEQETIIVQSRADDYVTIYTSNTHDLAYFKGRPEFELIREYRDQDGNIEAADFHLPKGRANIRKIVKRQVSEEQRKAASERLARSRSERNLP